MANLEAVNEMLRVAEATPDNELFDMSEIHQPKGCGTAHCLLGYMAIDPWFQERALNSPDSRYLNYGRVLSLLDLGWQEYDILFGYDRYHTRESGPEIRAKVIANIKRLRDGEELEPYADRGGNWLGGDDEYEDDDDI